MHYVSHPKHGRMPIPDMGEVKRLEQFGWTLDAPKEKPAEVKRGRGRPPKAK